MSTRGSVLAALRRAGEHGVSGEALAGDLGVSRVAVSKHVNALRADGYTIEASPGTGYRLVSAPDEAVPAEVEPLVTATLWTRFEGGREVTSTNDIARELAREGAPEGTVVLAAAQTAGRGRLGREWASDTGGVYCSMVLRPAVAPVEAGPLALVIGLGVARGMEALGVDVRLKWPNDIWLSGRKLAGILLEMSAEHDRIDWIVAGVGLNVRPQSGAPGSAAVSEVAPGVSVASAAAALLDGVASAYRQWCESGFAPLVGEYARIDALLGETVSVSTMAGGLVARGAARGVDAQGRLLVERDDGEVVSVHAGEVTLR